MIVNIVFVISSAATHLWQVNYAPIVILVILVIELAIFVTLDVIFIISSASTYLRQASHAQIIRLVVLVMLFDIFMIFDVVSIFPVHRFIFGELATP